LLLSFGADPNQRGINDFTPLHLAVSERNAVAIQLVLDAGTDPDMPTRIDECKSAVEMAQAAGLHEVAAMLVRKGQPLRQRLRSGLTLLVDVDGGTLLTEVRIDRRALIPGLFYGVDGMRVGGTRRLEIAPHLAYGVRGVPGVIPPDALLYAEIAILSAAHDP
jgi:hypothetical protein